MNSEKNILTKVYHIEDGILVCGSRWGSPYLTQCELEKVSDSIQNTIEYYKKNKVTPEELNAKEAILFDKMISGK